MLCEKYKPACFADIRGQSLAVDKIKAFFRNFPKKKAIILHGPPGSGKTSLAYVLAAELDAEIVELNASDLRNKAQLIKILKPATQQRSLFYERKIMLVDEVDGISGYYDRGGLPELIALIEKSKFPIIITANDIWDRKFSLLRRRAELVQLKEVSYGIIFEIIKEISQKEKIDISDSVLKNISSKAKGDIRAALNDLESLRFGGVKKPEDLSERDKATDIFNSLRHVFKDNPNHMTTRIFDSVDMNLDQILLWLEENIPLEYQGEELAKAMDALSKADVFRGRIYRQQYWRFLVYQNFLLSFGVAAAKKTAKSGFTSYRKPGRILKIWLIKQKLQKKHKIVEKYARFSHMSKKKAAREFLYLALIYKESMSKDLDLTEDEARFLQEMKH